MSERANKHHSHMMKGALILSMAALVTKVLSAVYKVPFQNLTGDKGFYVYQQIYPFYGIAVALALNGLPLFISKLVAEEEADRQMRVLKEIGLWLMLGSGTLFLLFWLGADLIALLMGDPELTPVIRSVSYIYLFIPGLASIRGYFQGNLDMVPTGISQVGEQIARITVLLAAAYLFTLTDWSVYQMGTYALSSSWVAGIIGLSILILYVLKRNTENDRNAAFVFFRGERVQKRSFLRVGKRLAIEGLPLTAMSSMMVLFQLIDSFTVYNGLINAGFTEALAMNMKGIYDRGQPFVQLGLVAGLGISTSALPLLRRYSQEKKTAAWKQSAVSVLKLTLLFSGAAAVGLIAIMPWLNEALFADQSGTAVLQVFVISVLLASMISITLSILQSSTSQLLPIAALSIGLLFKLLMNQFAVRYAGVMGSSYLTVLSLLLVLLIMSTQLPIGIWHQLFEKGQWIKMPLVLSVMGVITHFGVGGLAQVLPEENRLTAFVLALAGVLVGGVAFLLGLTQFNLLSEQEWHYMPFSKIYERIQKKK
ncbi:putative polysaccharide biosynthesis protein [Marinilactibacillus piezotolerans]|uniref:putative polysaccharide biosynthesis protein n=1 Tax=Marinilactibacillus piezotolerans TaxID=258723 RepID=UPI0009AFEEAA|nr:polysaccharide biosynthesis protein [Marinilactibacillus piezotolerans]